MAPKSKKKSEKKNKSKTKNKKSSSKPTRSCISLSPCQTPPSSPTRPSSSPLSSSPSLTISSPPTRLSLSPTRSSLSPTRSSLSSPRKSPPGSPRTLPPGSPRTSPPSSSRTSPLGSPRTSPPCFPIKLPLGSPIKSSPSPPRKNLTPLQETLNAPFNSIGGFQRISKDANVLTLDSKEPSSIDNDESGWTQIIRKQSRNRKILVEEPEKKLEKKSCYFLSNQLSPSRTPPDEELENLQHQRLATSSNQMKTLILDHNLKDLVGIELKMKSNEPPSILKRPIRKGILGMVV